MGCKIRRLPRSGKLALRLRWKMDGRRFDTQEQTGLSATVENIRILERDFSLPVSREMHVGAFTRERYLDLFPYGTRAAEFRRDLGIVIAERPLKADSGVTLGAYYRQWIERKKPPYVRVSRARDY